jgi:hypothetical protein
MASRNDNGTRRDLLRASVAGAVGLALARSALAEGGRTVPGRDPMAPQPGGAPAKPKTERAVLVAFAGGVRARELIGTPANVPNLLRIAKDGVVMPSVRAANLGHYGAALSIFTGTPDARGIRENARGPNPTLFEYLRKQHGWGPEEVWLSAADGAQTVNFSHGLHPDYGAAYGANLIGSDGIFNAEFRTLLESFGKPRLPGGDEGARLDRLAKAFDPATLAGAKDKRFADDPEHARRMQKFLLEELTGGTAGLTGPGSGDAKAIRVATKILRAFRPKVVGVVLGNADVAHGSFNAYQEVIRRNDRELGVLWDAVQADPALKDSTSIFILPEFGRDANLNQRNGLDHGDGSEDLGRVCCIAAGPEIAKGRTYDRMVESTDIAPTIAGLLGATMPHARGKAIKAILQG